MSIQYITVFKLSGYNMNSSNRDGVKASVLTYHRIIEAFKFGYAWRSRLGDPAFNNSNNDTNKVGDKKKQCLGSSFFSFVLLFGFYGIYTITNEQVGREMLKAVAQSPVLCAYARGG